jgi:hypothetical protein
MLAALWALITWPWTRRMGNAGLRGK